MKAIIADTTKSAMNIGDTVSTRAVNIVNQGYEKGDRPALQSVPFVIDLTSLASPEEATGPCSR